MLKWAGLFLVIMIVAGGFGVVLGFAGWFAKGGFVVCLVGVLGSPVSRKGRGG